MKRINRNNDFIYDDYEPSEEGFEKESTTNSIKQRVEPQIDYSNEYDEEEINEEVSENLTLNSNDYKVIDKNSRFKILVGLVICVALSLTLVIVNSALTHKQVGETTTVTGETTVVDVSDIATTESASSEPSENQTSQEKTTVVYQLPPDLSVYGTWQMSDGITMKISYGGDYTYTVKNKSLDGVWTGEKGTIVCGEKALTKTGLSYREVQTRYGVLPQNFNIDNFYYIYLPFEYVSFDGNEKVPASADFQDCVAELYFYLWNDKDGNLKAYSYVEREGEDSLIVTLDQIKGEE